MAKHKKKKFKPTPDPKDTEKSDLPPTESNIPPTETDIPPTETGIPPKVPEIPFDEMEVSRKVKKIFWMRLALSILAGAAATYLFESIEGEERRWASIGFLVIVYILTVMIAKGMRLNLPPSKKRKPYIEGLGSYVFLYLFVWIMTYTFAHISDNTGRSFPFT